MKNKLEWHKECLKNFTSHYTSKIQELEKLKADILRMERELRIRHQQIETAEKDGVTEYDGEKYLIVKRRKL